MLRSYRSVVFAVGLALASPCYSQEAKHSQADSRQNTPAQLERIATAIEKQPIAAAPDRGCQPSQDDRQSDLCAQWKAADAATESARWSLWMLWISGFGLLVGGGTFLAAWRAAHWAKKAADHTEAGAKAAKDAVAETKRIGEAQVRAYPSIVRAQWHCKDGFAFFQFFLENSGNSPARKIAVNSSFSVIHDGSTIWSRAAKDLNSTGAIDLPSQQKWKMRDVLGLPAEIGHLPDLIGAGARIEVTTSLVFIDVFGNLQRTDDAWIAVDIGVEKCPLLRVEFDQLQSHRTANDDSRNRGQ